MKNILNLIEQDNPRGSNYTNHDKNYHLRIAARIGDTTKVKNILSSEVSVDVNANDKLLGDDDSIITDTGIWSMTALSIAAYFNHIDIVKLLIRARASQFIYDIYNYGPLETAIFRGNNEIAKFLAKKRSREQIDFHAGLGNTPLLCACEAGNLEIVNILINKNADPIWDMQDFGTETQECKGFTPLSRAAFYGNHNIVEFLLTKDIVKNNIDQENNSNDTALTYAVSAKNIETNQQLAIVKTLIENGANVYHRNFSNQSPLDIAGNNNSVKLSEALRQALKRNSIFSDSSSEDDSKQSAKRQKTSNTSEFYDDFGLLSDISF